MEDSIQNKRVITILNQGIHTAKQNQVDLSLMEDIKENIEEANDHEKEVANAFAQFVTLNEEDEQAINDELDKIQKECGIITDN